MTGAAAVALLMQACSNAPKETAAELKGINVAEMDTTISPCDDFYHYAAGRWLKENPVPPTETRWASFNLLVDKNNEKLKTILEAAAENKTAEKGSNTQKLGTIYRLGMDSAKLAEQGIAPLQKELEKINALTSKDGLSALLAEMHASGVDGFFGVYVGQDDKKSDTYALNIYQSGLGLPDRDFYFAEDERSEEVRSQYKAHLSNMFGIAAPAMAAQTGKVYGIEESLANVSMRRVEMRDPEKTYNKIGFAELNTLAPAINWDVYFKGLGIAAPDSIIVNSKEFISGMSATVSKASIDDIKTYLSWNLIAESSNYLDDAIATAQFEFYGKQLNGQKEQKPRWKRVLGVVNGTMGQLLGQEFVKENFTPETKAKVDGLVKNVVASLRERITNLEWMSEATKKEALTKLDAIGLKIGYPEVWKDYNGLTIEDDSYLANYMRASKFARKQNFDKLGKEVDRKEWFMSPQTVNAYYSPSMNEIVFPAGILQPPFYDPMADDAVNYGGIGSVIGHELTHGFDDSGNKFDANGNLRNWWTEADYAAFKVRAQKVVNQYNGFEALPGLFVNGELTLGENIADLGGVKISYYAYMKSLEGKEKKSIDGFTPEQRFFLSNAQIWKGNYTEQALRQQVLTNVHSPGQFRAIGPLQNLTEYFAAFPQCKEGAMFRPDSVMVTIW